MLIRQIHIDDAEQLLHLKFQLDQETAFMLYEPGERTTTVKEEHKQLERFLSTEHGIIFVAEQDGQFVGYLEASSGRHRRDRHSLYIATGILQAFTGQGIGTQLFLTMEEWARQKHLHRLELTVMTHNVAGIALYKKRGFEIEGIKKHAYIVDGKYVDEYVMAKLLDGP